MMIEEIVKGFVEGRLSVPVHMEVPANPPDCFVVLRKGDGRREEWVETSTFVADSYAPTLYKAAKLNEEVKACMDALTDLPEIYGAHLDIDYPLNDTENKRYRYQAVYDINH